MMLDEKGQISLEYLLIFTISLIILIVFTMPLSEMTIKNTLDISQAMDMKSDLSKLSQAIKQVYGQGQGSRQTVLINAPSSQKLDVGNNYVLCNLKLKDNSNKLIKFNFESNLGKSTIQLSKGDNEIIVEWPDGSKNMNIYKK